MTTRDPRTSRQRVRAALRPYSIPLWMGGVGLVLILAGGLLAYVTEPPAIAFKVGLWTNWTGWCALLGGAIAWFFTPNPEHPFTPPADSDID